jgi:hypothetical protein
MYPLGIHDVSIWIKDRLKNRGIHDRLGVDKMSGRLGGRPRGGLGGWTAIEEMADARTSILQEATGTIFRSGNVQNWKSHPRKEIK